MRVESESRLGMGSFLGIAQATGAAGLENDEQFILHGFFMWRMPLLFGHLFDYSEYFIFQSKRGAAH